MKQFLTGKWLFGLAVLLGFSGCTPTPVPAPAATPTANVEATARPATRDYWACSEGKAVCQDDPDDWLARIQVPPGFTVSHLVQLPSDVAPTSITYGPNGLLYVATIPRPFKEDFSGKIYVLTEDSTFKQYATGFLLPIGLAFRPGTSDLYVSSRAGRFEGKVSLVQPDSVTHDVITGLPCCYTGMEHQPNGLVFGPDGLLYLAIGARTDHGEKLWDEPAGFVYSREAGILRIWPDLGYVEPYVHGLRNPYDLDFDTLDRLWTDDNGPDFGLPDRVILVEKGAHYGFPYYGAASCADCLDPPPDLIISPAYAELPVHATPAGLTVYKGEQFPSVYLDSVLVALWNPGPGGKIVRVHGDHQVDDFVTGLWGPIDIVNTPDGAIVVADYLSGRLFKVSWTGLP